MVLTYSIDQNWTKLWFQRLNERFRRLTSGGQFVPEIDGLRFVAIASVVVFHLHAQLVRYYGMHLSTVSATLLGHGERGVRLFFVISGFVLALPFASRYLQGSPPINLKNYFKRRLTRLEPPYVINLVLCAVLLIIVSRVPISAVLPHLLASLFYSHNLFYGSMSTINVVAWSLEVEVQFYIIMPLLAIVFSVRSELARRATILAAMLVAGLLQAHWDHSLQTHLSIAYYIQYFLAGFILADLYLTTNCSLKRYRWDVISLVGWPIVFLLDGPLSQVWLPVVSIALCWSAFHGRLTNHLFRVPLLTTIGGMCYTIYLFHFLTIAFATRILGHAGSPLLLIIISLPLIAVVSSVYFLLIEKPCMDRNWPRKLGALFVQCVKRWSAVATNSQDRGLPALPLRHE